MEEDNDTGTLIVRQMNKTKDVGEYKCIVDGKHKASLNITKIFGENKYQMIKLKYTLKFPKFYRCQLLVYRSYNPVGVKVYQCDYK